MERTFSLVIVRSLTDEEIFSVDGQELEYIKENCNSSCFKLFTEEEIAEYWHLRRYVRPVEVFSDGELTKFYVAYIDLLKTYTEDMSKDFILPLGGYNHHITDYKGNVRPGYYPISSINYYPIIKDVDKAIKMAEEECPGDIVVPCKVMVYTYDLNA